MNTQKTFLKEMTAAQIEKLEKAVFHHLRKAQYFIDLRNGLKRTFKPLTAAEVERTLGLPYTSSSSVAGLWVTNEELMYDETRRIIGFGMDSEENPIAWAWDDEENEIVITL